MKAIINNIEKREDDKKLELFLSASHQLKTPVAITQWCLGSLLESETIKGHDLEMVRRGYLQVEAMSHLIADMLHLFRLERNDDWKRKFEKVSLQALLDEVLVQYIDVAKRKSISLQKAVIENGPQVLVDPGYLKQVIINLLENAIKYSPEGKTVIVSIKYINSKVHLSVEDCGIGISKADQKLLFREFFRTEAAVKFAHEGSGLGLVFAKRVAEEFGGEILLESEVGKGSKFTLELPA